MARRILNISAAAVLVTGIAQAATATASFNVTLEIQAECLVNSATDLDFGVHGVLATNVDVTSTLTVQCTNTTLYTIALDVGTGVGASVAARRMTGPSLQTVAYALYRDASHLQLWGTTTGVNRQPGTGNGAAQAYTVYGRIPPQTTPGTGNYADIITATIEY